MKKTKKYNFKDGQPVPKTTRLLNCGALIVALGLAVVSWLVLPDQVAIQAINGGKTFMPKIVAMAAPTIVAVGAALFGLFTNYKALATKAVIISAVGDFLFIMHLCLTLF